MCVSIYLRNLLIFDYLIKLLRVRLGIFHRLVVYILYAVVASSYVSRYLIKYYYP